MSKAKVIKTGGGGSGKAIAVALIAILLIVGGVGFYLYKYQGIRGLDDLVDMFAPGSGRAGVTVELLNENGEVVKKIEGEYEQEFSFSTASVFSKEGDYKFSEVRFRYWVEANESFTVEDSGRAWFVEFEGSKLPDDSASQSAQSFDGLPQGIDKGDNMVLGEDTVELYDLVKDKSSGSGRIHLEYGGALSSSAGEAGFEENIDIGFTLSEGDDGEGVLTIECGQEVTPEEFDTSDGGTDGTDGDTYDDGCTGCG